MKIFLIFFCVYLHACNGCGYDGEDDCDTEVEVVDTNENFRVVDDILDDIDINTSPFIIKLHGCLMIVAWIGAASIGTFVARYYKHSTNEIYGMQQWFLWHKICMAITWTLTVTSFILIFVDMDGWSQEDNPHAVLGVLTTIICFFQPILAAVRPRPSDVRRKYFNWGHMIGGILSHILAIMTIFVAVNLSQARLSDMMYYFLAAFVIFHIMSHIVITKLNETMRPTIKILIGYCSVVLCLTIALIVIVATTTMPGE